MNKLFLDPLPENGEETTVTACVRIDTNTCQVSENILVRDCGNVRIYQLKSTKVDQSAYCVGKFEYIEIFPPLRLTLPLTLNNIVKLYKPGSISTLDITLCDGR